MKCEKINYSFEIFPPKKGIMIDTIYETIEKLVDLKPQFISVTYGAGGSIRNNKTVELASFIKNKENMEAITHLTCINSTCEEIDIILEDLKKEKIDKILALRGDRNPEFEDKKDFSYAVDLVNYIKEKGDFKIYGGCYPEGHLECDTYEEDIIHLKEKVDAGVGELISQLFFDNNVYYKFLDDTMKKNINVPIHAGIMPVTNLKSILRMTVMCGASIPRPLMKLLAKYQYNEGDLRKAGIEYSIKQIEELNENGVDNIHLYVMNNADIAKEILK